MKERICAVVVTYNRKNLLQECLTALKKQTYKLDHIVVVDNASTDGTFEMLQREFPEVETLKMHHNKGGAGGFYEGMKHAYERGFDWLWLMDDDTIPQENALYKLIEASKILTKNIKKPFLLASKVEWLDGSVHPMNTPAVKTADPDLLMKAVELGYLSIRSTSFVSLLVHRHAITNYGFPIKSYFIWNDDVEYTARVLKHESGFLVPQSVVVHKTKQKYIPATGSKPERFYYGIRNKLWMLRLSNAWSREEKFKILLILIRNIAQFLAVQRFSARAVYHVLRGIKDGLLRRPDEHE